MVGIITVAFGCDNVSWGGMEVSLQGPPPDTAAASTEAVPEEPPPIRELGPLLYAAVRTGDSAVVVPVAELGDSGLAPLPAGSVGEEVAIRLLEERFQPGTEFTLFHQGSRVGTLVLDGPPEMSPDYCSPRPQGRGILELVPAAGGAERFMALEPAQGYSRPHHTLPTVSSGRAHWIAAQNLGGEALNEVGARWPVGLQNIREDLQVIQLSTDADPAVVATFLYDDQMGVSPASEDAYSLLVLGEPRGNQWNRTFTWFRTSADDGKGAPRFFSQLDVFEDGTPELFLEVFGVESRWWAALSREGRDWRVTFQDPCGAPRPGGEIR
jgi:hypothetical protein